MIRQALVRMMYAEIRGQFSPLYDFLTEHPEHLEIVKEVWNVIYARLEQRMTEEIRASNRRDLYVVDEWTTTSRGEYPSGESFRGPKEIDLQYQRALRRYWRLHIPAYRMMEAINQIAQSIELDARLPF